jgi:hypothetical protein
MVQGKWVLRENPILTPPKPAGEDTRATWGRPTPAFGRHKGRTQEAGNAFPNYAVSGNLSGRQQHSDWQCADFIGGSDYASNSPPQSPKRRSSRILRRSYRFFFDLAGLFSV